MIVGAPKSGVIRIKVPRAPAPDGSESVRAVLDALYDTVLVTDPIGKILESNGRAERHLGYSREDLQGQPIARVIDGLTGEVIAGLHQNLNVGKFTVLEAYCRTKEQSGFLAELTVGRLGQDGDSRLLFTLRNIEPRKKTQEMLREAHNAMENSASGIVIADREGRILRGNPAFLTMWGYSNRRAVEGRNVRELWGDVQAPEDLFLLPLSGKTWMGEQEARTRKGRTIFVQVSAAPNRDSDEKLAGVVFSFVDVTARRKAEDALRREAEAQKTKARASNEFSGLLTALTLPDLVQLIASAKKTGTLVVLGEKENPMATVGFVKGELRSAACSERTGEEAFFELLRLGGEGFRFEARPPAESEQTIQRSTLGLLLEGTQRLDESFLSDTAPQGALDAEKIEVSQGIASSGK